MVSYTQKNAEMRSTSDSTDRVDVREARRFLERRIQKRTAENRRRLEQARGDFRKIANRLAKEYNVKRIYQWGSLLNERHFSEISDIDIAVEGEISAEEYFAMLGDAIELTDFPIDLVELDKIDPLHARSIRTNGRLVYERAD